MRVTYFSVNKLIRFILKHNCYMFQIFIIHTVNETTALTVCHVKEDSVQFGQWPPAWLKHRFIFISLPSITPSRDFPSSQSYCSLEPLSGNILKSIDILDKFLYKHHILKRIIAQIMPHSTLTALRQNRIILMYYFVSKIL